MRRRLAVSLAAVVAIGAAAVLALRQPAPPPVVVAPASSAFPALDAGDAMAAPGGESNILRGDYKGPEACRTCHAARFEQWSRHPHSKMNQNATPASVLGDFANATLTLPGGEVLFARTGDAFTMTLQRAGATVRRYRVTRTVG